MPIKITNKQIPVHIEYFDFMPRWSLEKAEYEKATIKSIDEKPQSRFNPSARDKQTILKMKGDLGEVEDHWPRMPTTEEIIYYQFLDKITDKDKQNRFHPARDEDRKPQPKTGAMHVITDIIRVKIDDNEFLLSKGNIVAHDAAGVEVTHYLPSPERWFKTLFIWESQYSDKTKQFQKICLGPKDVEAVYTMPFTKDNAKELFNQRANDNQLNFLVKDGQTEEVRRVEPDVNVQKTFDLFVNNTWDYLFSGEYVPAPVRAELRQEAVARGYIKGGSADYQVTAQPTKTGKNAYQ